jgi:magnesium-transporting ATPase (P-type)
MQKSARIYKGISFVFNGLGIALVICGVVGYIFFDLDYVRSQIYLLAALLSAFVTTLFRIVAKNVELPIGSKKKPDIKVIGWAFVNAIAWLIFFALRLFTDFLRSPKTQYSCVLILCLLGGSLAFHQYRVHSKHGFKLTYIHWLGIIVVMGVLVLLSYEALTS